MKDLIIINSDNSQNDVLFKPEFRQLNAYKKFKDTLLNSYKSKFNLGGKFYNSVDEYYKFVANLYPDFKLESIYDTLNSEKIPYKLMALALYSKFTQNPYMGLYLVLTRDSDLSYEYKGKIFRFELLEKVRKCIVKFGDVNFDQSFINSIISRPKSLLFGLTKNNKLFDKMIKMDCRKDKIDKNTMDNIISRLSNFKIVSNNKHEMIIRNNDTNKIYSFLFGKQLGVTGKEGTTLLITLKETGQQYAFKIFKKNKAFSTLSKEAAFQYLASLDNITPRVFGIVFEENKTIGIKGIIMEKLDYTLKELLKIQGGFLTKYQEFKLVEIVIKLSNICIFHGDNNPLNLMWSISDNKFYYIDFGFSKFLSQVKSDKKLYKKLYWNLQVLNDCFIGYRLGFQEKLGTNEKGESVKLPAVMNSAWWKGSFVKRITEMAQNKGLETKDSYILEQKIIKFYNEFKQEVSMLD